MLQYGDHPHFLGNDGTARIVKVNGTHGGITLNCDGNGGKTMGTFQTWEEAHADAQRDADTMRRPMALEKAQEYGRTVYRVKMVPADPNKRFGWEARCEIVEPH